jgi:hypothetical protein
MVTAVLPATPLGINTHFNEGDRYLYYSSFYVCFLLAILLFNLFRRKIAWAISLTLTTLFIAMLWDIQRNYAYASAVTSISLKTIENSGSPGTAFFIDVPGKYKGALIYRVGLEEAIKWGAPDARFAKIIIVSEKDADHRYKPYTIQEVEWNILAVSKKWDQKQKAIYSDSAVFNLRQNDRVFWFTDQGFYKVKF